MFGNLTIENVRPMCGTLRTVHVSGGVYSSNAHADATVLDAKGCALLPGFVDAHMHLDKTLWGLSWRPHTAGRTLAEKIENERMIRSTLGVDTRKQATALVEQASRNGTTLIRTHVDVDPDTGLQGIHALLEVKERVRNMVDLEVVAFPQCGLISKPGTAELLDAAIAEGADLVGGIDPQGIDGDAKAHIRTIFEIADRRGVGIDIHHHEENDAGADTLDLILDATESWDFRGRLTLSHAFCIGMVSQQRKETLLSRIADLDVAVMTHAPGYKAFPPVNDLYRHGIRACSGSDGVRDVWTPYGNADMLERAMLIGYRSNYRKDEEIERAFDMCTYGGARTLHRLNYGLEIGCKADAVLIEAETIPEAVVSRPSARTVIKNGIVVQ